MIRSHIQSNENLREEPSFMNQFTHAGKPNTDVSVPYSEYYTLLYSLLQVLRLVYPFNPSTRISLTVPTRSHVRLVVYDILGREVNVMVDETLAPGTYVSDWDGRNRFGERVSSGVYFY